MSHDVRKPTFLFPTRSDTNRAVQRKKMGRALKFWIKKVEGFYYMYPCSENKGADQLCVTVKLIRTFAFAYANCWFSHDVAHIMISRRSHTGVASKTRMSERHSLLGLGSKAKQTVENVLTTSTENLQQTLRLQYSRQYNLQVLASVQSKKSAVKPSI